MYHRWVVLLAAPILIQSAFVRAQEPTLGEVLIRAGDYVDGFHQQLSGVVAEERYEQRASTPVVFGLGVGSFQRRTLRSDYLLIQPDGEDRHYGFRDVFEVDGSAVRDRADRLMTLFLEPSSSSTEQIQGILRDSARYNIGSVVRNINTPTFPLLFLRTTYQSRFVFTRVTEDAPSLGLDRPGAAGDVWVVEYSETGATTVVGGRDDSNLPARGRFWIEEPTGRVWLSEFILEDPEMDAMVAVAYDADETLGHLVPAEMRERYHNRLQGSRVDGTATYSRFRRFEVQVDESTPPPADSDPSPEPD